MRETKMDESKPSFVAGAVGRVQHEAYTVIATVRESSKRLLVVVRVSAATVREAIKCHRRVSRVLEYMGDIDSRKVVLACAADADADGQ